MKGLGKAALFVVGFFLLGYLLTGALDLGSRIKTKLDGGAQ